MKVNLSLILSIILAVGVVAFIFTALQISSEFIRIGDASRSRLTVLFYANAEYIDNLLNDIWLRNFVRWFLQAMLFSAVTLLIIRRSVIMPINKIVEWVKAARFGHVE